MSSCEKPGMMLRVRMTPTWLPQPQPTVNVPWDFPEVQNELNKLIAKYHNVFSSGGGDVGKSRVDKLPRSFQIFLASVIVFENQRDINHGRSVDIPRQNPVLSPSENQAKFIDSDSALFHFQNGNMMCCFANWEIHLVM